MQIASERFWVLSYLVKELKKNQKLQIQALVGATRNISASPEWDRFSGFTYVSDLFLPQLQILHSIRHNNPEIVVGTTLFCRVAGVEPVTNHLELEVVRVEPYERSQAELIRLARCPIGDS